MAMKISASFPSWDGRPCNLLRYNYNYMFTGGPLRVFRPNCFPCPILNKLQYFVALLVDLLILLILLWPAVQLLHAFVDSVKTVTVGSICILHIDLGEIIRDTVPCVDSVKV